MVVKLSLFVALLALSAPVVAEPDVAGFPAEQHAGPFKSGHVQGIAVDRTGGYIYYSFTNMLAKYDMRGRLVGTLVGWTGHLGDLDFNDADGRIYGSLEYGKDKAFYIAVIEGSRINRVGIPAQGSGLLQAVYLPEVARDFAATSPDHRYGCSGIDGVAFGPAFGRTTGRKYMTVAYGIYGDVNRTDNDHQLLLQYDVTDWARYARPLSEARPHHAGPGRPRNKIFVRTGNSRYGVQNLAYDETLQRWFMGVYKGAKPHFPNFGLFAVDARSRPVIGELIGVKRSDGAGLETGLLLPLASDGLIDADSGVRGWDQKADVGIQPLGHGLYYLATNARTPDGQTADIRLMRWAANAEKPFIAARPESNGNQQ